MASTVGRVKSILPPNMEFFKKPLVNTGQLSAYYVEHEARSPLDITEQSQIEIHVPESVSDFIDLTKTTLRYRMRLEKVIDGVGGFAFTQDVADPSNSEIVIPIDAFPLTQFKNFTMTMGSGKKEKIVHNSNNDHDYMQYIDLRLRTKDEDMPLATHETLFTREDGFFADPTKPLHFGTGGSENTGAQKRWERVQHRQVFETQTGIPADFIQPNMNLLPNQVSFKLVFTPGPNRFRFMVSPPSLYDKFRLVIEKVTLNVAYIRMSQEALKGYDAGMRLDKTIYPYMKREMHILPLHKGIQVYRCPDMFNRQLPVEVILAMVPQRNASGTFNTNPFVFARNNIAKAFFYLNNISIPNTGLEFGNQNDEATNANQGRQGPDEWRMKPLNALWEVAGTKENGIDYTTYDDGNFFICFKTDPTAPSSGEYWATPKTGVTSLQLFFHEPLQDETELFVMVRYPALLTIDHDRMVETI